MITKIMRQITYIEILATYKSIIAIFFKFKKVNCSSDEFIEEVKETMKILLFTN